MGRGVSHERVSAAHRAGELHVRDLRPDPLRGDRSGLGWLPWVWLSGEARVLMMLLTLQPPVRGGGPKQRWAGCLDWFRVMGEALDFEAREADEGDDAVA
jgi:hypothetical protein